MRERRLKLVAFDVDPNTGMRDLELPVTEEYPEGTKIISAFPYPLQNCVLAFVMHPTFPETEPFQRFDASVLPIKEA